MAQLTWRNIDAPNFSGVTDALRLAGQSLTSGLSAGREAMTDFQKGQTTSESARLMTAAAGETDPAKLQAIIAGFDPRHITPDAMKVALGRPQDLATLDQTKASTNATNVTTAFNRDSAPLKLEGLKLGNSGQVIQNAQAGANLNQTVWSNANAQKEYAAAPAWNQTLAQYRALRSDPSPAAQAAASTMAASPDFATKAAAAGVKGDALTTVLDKGELAASAAVKLKENFMALGENERKTNLATQSRDLVQNSIDATGSPAGAQDLIERDAKLSPDLREAALKRLTEVKANYKTPDVSEILTNNAAAASRPTLGTLTSAAQANGLVVTSAFRGPDHPLTLANPNSAHAKGKAFDLRARTEEEADAVISKQKGIFASIGMQEGRDYKIIDEVRKPAGHATGPHVHVELTAEGESRQNSGTGNKVQDILNRSNQPVQPPNLRGSSGGQIALGPAPGLSETAQAAARTRELGVMLDTPQALVSNDRVLNTLAGSVSNTSMMDGALNSGGAVAQAFLKRPEKLPTSMEVAAQIHKTGGDKEDGGMFSRSKLTIENINDAVTHVVNTHKVDPDIAGALVQSAIKSTGNWAPWMSATGRSLDTTKVSEYVSRFIGKDGKPKTEVLNIMNQKAMIEEQATKIKEKLTSAKEIWLGAQGAAQNGNTKIDLTAANERYAKAQRAADAMLRKLQENPNVSANSASNTRM